MVQGIVNTSSLNTVHLKPSNTGGLKSGIDALKSVASESSVSEKISTLSRQLGESAMRAELRDKSLSRQELGMLATTLTNQFLGEPYAENKAEHALEVPITDDPQLLERARLATAYVTKSAQHDPSAINPFAALSMEQANLIAYDDKGPYTLNERHAAWSRSFEIERQWRMDVVTRGTAESNNNGGRSPGFYTECLEHYKSLPAIEQAQYSEGYEARLNVSIHEDGGARKPEQRLLTLFEILAEIQLPEIKKEEPPPVKDKPEVAYHKGEAPPVKAAPVVESPPVVTTSSLSPDVSPTPVAALRS